MGGGDSTSAEDLTFSILGPIRVLRDGVPINLGGPRQRVVLARLVIDPGKTVPLGTLASAIWSDVVPPGYVSTVQTYVFHLRRSLEPTRTRGAPASVLVGDPGGYRLAVGRTAVDAARFEDLVASGSAHAQRGEFDEASAQLTAALGLWRGPVLADLAEFGFAAPIVGKLEELRLEAVETRIDAELALGRNAAMAAELTDLVRRYPLHERLHAQRMLALYRCGRQSDALAAYAQLRTLLVDELGVEPSPPVQELHHRILCHDRGLAWVQPISSADRSPRAVASRYPEPRRAGVRRRLAFTALAAVLLVVAGATRGHVADRVRLHVSSMRASSIVGLGADGTIRAAFAVGGTPAAVAVSGDSAWVADTDESMVRQLDLETGVIHQRLSLLPQDGVAPVATTVLGNEVWVVNSGSANVSVISTVTGQVVATVAVGHHPSAITAGLGSVWVTNEGDATVTRIDPAFRQQTRVIDVGDAPDGIAVGDGAVWVANRADDTVSRIDPRTETLGAPIPVGAGPVGITVTPQAVWVADSLDLTVSRIDPRTLEVTKTKAGETPTDVTAFAGGVWVTDAGAGTVARLDPATGEPTAHYLTGGAPRDLVAAGDTLWTVDQPVPAAAHRGGTLTIAVTSGGLGSVDPVAGYGSGTLPLLASVYDGLVGVHHADGAAGYELVPDLAIALPTPTAGGTVYTFNLRPGLRYSNGRRISAADIRRGLERAVQIATRLNLPDYYADIVGAAACARHPTRNCDLAQGIGIDTRAGIISIHLMHPNPDFLAELAADTMAAPTPAGAPSDDVGMHPIPGTGPYRISQFVPNRSLVLRRNPYFRTWSTAARPDGYPDVIRWVVKKSTAAALGAVEDGTADIAFPDFSDLPRLVRSYPDRLTQDPYPGTSYVVTNSAVPPFNNAIARQAVAAAFNQDPVIARLEGGAPACTIVPAGWPGQRETCPYPASLATARALVARSHTSGAAVHVFFVNYGRFKQIGEHVTNVLNRIGYHARLTLQDNYDPTAYDPRTRPVNIEGLQWFPDFPAISQFYDPMLSCTGLFAKLGCDPTLDRAAAHARQTQLTDPGAAQREWQRVYSQADRDARFIANSTVSSGAALESARVHNTRWSPFTGLVFDQLEVR